jgi:hypothetical protein
VFTHGGVIGQALAIATGSRPFVFIAADNASGSRLAVIGNPVDRPRLQRHTPPRSTTDLS